MRQPISLLLAMDAKEYLQLLKGRLEPFFDLEPDRLLSGQTIDLFAKSHVKHARTFLTPRDVIDAYDTFEYFLVKVFNENIGLDDFQVFENLLRQFGAENVLPGREHMCSLINGVLISERGITREAAQKIKRYAFTKSYFFSLKGWSEIRITAVDLIKEELVVSKRGRQLQKLCGFKR